MGSSSRYSNSRTPKRKPPKRRISTDTEKNSEKIPACSTSQTEVPAASLSASAHKIKNNLLENNIEMLKKCYFIVNGQFLTGFLSAIEKSPHCLASIDVNHLLTKKQLLSHFLNILCTNCGWSSDFCTPREMKSQRSDKSSYEVNVRAVIGCREVGIGQKGLVIFCNMNIPEPINYLAYGKINSKLYIAYSEIARESLFKAADMIRQRTYGDNFSNDVYCQYKGQ